MTEKKADPLEIHCLVDSYSNMLLDCTVAYRADKKNAIERLLSKLARQPVTSKKLEARLDSATIDYHPLSFDDKTK